MSGGHLNIHVARRLFDTLTDCEIAHQSTGICRHDYLTVRRKQMKGLAGREMDRILDLGPEQLPVWMDVFINEFEDWL